MTYSIVGRDAETGDLGVAIQSQAFNSGAGVPWAWAGVGAVATQASTDRRYGWRGLEMIPAGSTPQETLEDLRRVDSLAEFRQVGMMSVDGRTAQWTGANCVPESENPRWRDYVRALSKYPDMDAFARLLANRH